MKVNKKPFLVAFIAIVLAMISWMLLSFKVVSAAQVSNPNQRVAINAIGLDANSAVIKDKNGNVVNGSDATTNNSYSVNYNWKIPDDVTVSAGDTATFELPSGVKLTSDLTNFPIHDEQGRVVGTFSIKANEKTGTITFNEGFNGYNHIGGTLQIFASGAKNPNDFDWNISKGGWVYDYDENGMLKNIIWNITFNPDGESLTNVVITDNLGPNQEYVDSSVYAQTGYFAPNALFLPDGGVLNPKVSVEGNKISFDFGNVNKAVNMSFRVKPTVNPNGSNKWTNDAVLTSDQIKGDSSADVSWGGSGNGGGTSSSSLTLVKKDAVTGALLANAGYNLLDLEGKVVREHLTTNSNGQINLYNLPKGDYSLVEIEAPEGYELNKEPIKFTVTGNETAPIELSQTDQPITGGVVLSKLDETTYEGLAGAEFKLLDEAGNVVKDSLYTDETGKLEISGLQPGKYSFVEVKAPEGYELDSTPIEFTISKDQTEAIELTKLDISEPNSNESTGGFKLTKTDKSSKVGLPGAVYELRFENGNVVSESLTTDKDGKIFLDELAPGKYTLVEIKAPEGYELNSTPISFTVLPDDVTILTATNSKVTEPSQPGEPSEPENPVEPNPPVKPGEPSEPEKPVKPNPPVKPGEPSEPETPVELEKPVLPGGSTATGDSQLVSLGNEGQQLPTSSYATVGHVKKTFPQTGDKDNPLLSVFGFTMLVGLAGFEMKHRH